MPRLNAPRKPHMPTTNLPPLAPRAAPLIQTPFTAYESQLACALALHVRFQDGTRLDRSTISQIMYSIYAKDLSIGFLRFDEVLGQYLEDPAELAAATEWVQTAQRVYEGWLDPYGEWLKLAIEEDRSLRIPER